MPSKKNIEAIYPLSPQQQGMLFETLSAGEVGIHIEQESYQWRGVLDTAAFHQAWQRVLDRHMGLRTAFVWRDQREPLQVVMQRVPLALEQQDWRALPATEQEERLAAHMRADRRRGFELSRAPLLRFALFRIDDSLYRVVSTFHHLLMDGWCLPIIENEFLAFYSALSNGGDLELEPARQYREYVGWIKRQDMKAAEEFWRTALRGFTRPNALGKPGSLPRLSDPDDRYGNREGRLTASETGPLGALIRRHRITWNTLIQGVWALLLSRYSGEQDVIFGTTVSGRPPELAGAERIIGLFINTLPFRVTCAGERSLWSWLQDLQDRHLELRRYEHCSTGQVHQWSDVPGSLPLYESILVFENYPAEAPASAKPAAEGAVSDGASFSAGARTKFPLTILAATSHELTCRLIYDRRRLDEAAIDRVTAHLFHLLRKILEAPSQSVARLLSEIRESEIPSFVSRGAPRTEGATPRTPTEEILARIWAGVLGLQEIGRHQNFFEMGGHSLLATQLMSRVRSTFQIELPLRRLFESATIAGLAECIDAARRAEQGLAAPPITPVARAGNLPLSFSQQRLWFLDQLTPGSWFNNVPVAWRLRGELSTVALAQSLNEIVRRHEGLRTTFRTAEGQPFQEIGSALVLDLPVADLSSLPPTEQEAEAVLLATQEAERPFDLASGPLIRASLLRLSDREHVLLLTMHHIVSDGWSLGVFFNELGTLYDAFLIGKPSPLPALPIQYADFAVWQRAWLHGPVLEAQLAYWRQQLSGAPAALALPADRPRPAMQTFRGDDELLVLSRGLSAAIQELSQREGVTLFMTLLAAFKVLLSRYSGQQDVVVGSPIAGRNRTEIEGLIGFFINTLVLRTDLSGARSFRELLGRVREVALGAYLHQDLPFESLLEALQPERDLGRTPLFQVFFNVLNYAGGKPGLSGLDVESFTRAESGSRFDLTLYASERGPNIQLYLVYNPDLFDKDRMAELLRQYQELLREIVTDPDREINAYTIVTHAARTCLPDPCKELGVRWPGPVHDLFSRQAERVPSRCAISDLRQRYTYQELDESSNRVANALRQGGIARQDLVAIYGHRCAFLVTALLGVLKAGAAFLILDAADPAARLLDCVRIAKPRGWIQLPSAGPLPETLEQAFDSFACRVRITLAEEPLPFTSDAPGVVVGPDDLAHVVFTSGSTGAPKAVASGHGPLSHFVEWHGHTFGLNQTDRFSMLSGLSHDPLLRDILTPLTLGATLCIPDGEDLGVSHRLAGWMERESISVAHLTPTLAELLTESTADDAKPLPFLRYAFFGGDVLTSDHVSRMRKLAPSATCVNFYGATETPQAMAYFVARSSPDGERGRIPLGRGIDGVQILVLNASGGLAGIGELGEVHIRTPYLAKGYLGDQRLTEERFITNLFTGDPGDRLYRTGDLGRYLTDGSVEFAGRSDDQVKIRGFRIEPAEIEQALLRHPAVGKSLAMVREDRAGERRLVAYVVPRAGAAVSSSELRQCLREILPLSMLPSAIVVMDAWPFMANGKIDRRALPAPDANGHERERMFIGPRTPLEECLAGIWADVLRVRRVGVDDNFFEMGGHSLLASHLISRVRSALKVEVPLRRLFETPTVAGFAKVVEEIKGGTVEAATSIPRVARERHRVELSAGRPLVLPEALKKNLEQGSD